MIYDKLFIGGDLSGIQKFLYSITSRKAAVSLKGRSATLSDDMREIYYASTKKAVLEAGGQIANADELYCSGGKFFFIATVTDDIRERVYMAIDKCLAECRTSIWKEHHGQLGINICYVAFNEKDDVINVEGKYGEPPYVGQSKGPGQLWKVVSAGFALQKNQRFKELMLSDYDDFFANGNALQMGPNRKVCAVTGIEFDTVELKKNEYTIPAKGEDDEITVLPSVKRQIEKGETLRKDPKRGFKTFEEYATTDSTYKKIQNGEKGEIGDTYLAILRMDVDGLGKRFITGFKSLSEYKAFSNKLCDFFEKYVEEVLLHSIDEDGNIYKQFMNIIYAGGDDLFIVGRWDKVIDFAKLIHDETETHFENDGISISGGVAIVKPKYPISKAAEKAGAAEELAKQFNPEKNAFHMLGKTISWNKHHVYRPNDKEEYEHEFAYVKHFKDKFLKYIIKYNKDYGFSKSLLHKIMLYAAIADKNKERKARGKTPNYSYIWHISYHLTRFMEKYKGYKKQSDPSKQIVMEELYKFCRSLRDDHLPENKGRNLELLAVAARWAELTLQDREK